MGVLILRLTARRCGAVYLGFGGLFPRPPPDGLPVLLGAFGGVGVVLSVALWVFIFLSS